MYESNVKGDYTKLIRKLLNMRSQVNKFADQWVKDCVTYFHNELLHHLDTQGRGGQEPPLSEATKHIYSVDGEPDGSGIIDHIGFVIQKQGSNRWVGKIGIAKGNPTIVAKVQDSGAVIPVSDAVRGFMAARGIFLRQDTTHIYIPGRKFWQLSKAATKKFARSKLKDFIKNV